MYLSSSNILFDRVIAFLQVFGVGFLAFVGLFSTISDFLDPVSSDIDRATSLGIFLASFVFLIRGFYTLYMIGKAKQYNSLFQGDHDGSIELSRIAVLRGMPEHKCIQQIDRLIRKGYLVNCHLRGGNSPAVALHGHKTNISYLVHHKTRSVTIFSVFLASIADFFLFFTIFAIVGASGGDPDYLEALPIWIPLGLLNGGLLALAFAMRGLVGKAYRFNSLFTHDDDGSIPLKEVAVLLNIPEHKLAKQFDRLVHQGYLCKCTLETEPEPRIVLHNGALNAADRFTTVICPHCGATNTFPAGFVGKCAYCDSHVQV